MADEDDDKQADNVSEAASDFASSPIGDAETPATGASADQQDEGDEGDEVVVTIGEATPTSEETELAEAPTWIKDLRKDQRALSQENRELKAKLASLAGETKVVLGAEPTLESCDYDEDKFKTDLLSWNDRKRQVADQQRAEEAAKVDEQKVWDTKLAKYNEGKTSLKVKDFDEAEATVREALSTTQQGIIVQGAEDAAKIIFALGTNQAELKKLAAIKNPVDFSFAVAKLETKLKVTTRKPATQPERTVTGSGGVRAGSTDSQLEKLRAEADKTGDMTKVIAYKRKMKAK